ncbi:hypothetical protein NEOKW01_1460 [Nematocida sp. AWRm80]|nr:hypothetical protein NEOKW01_1460 [Nematocida sp. AWRm80]
MEEVEYLLRFLLGSTTLTVDSTKEYDSTKMESLLFLKKYKNQKVISGFIPVNKTGHIVTPFFGVPIDEENIHHKVLYCHIAIGRTLFTSVEYAMNCKTPKGYDSFIISKNGTMIESVISEFKKTQSFEDYSYVIPDESRVLVLGEVEFTYDKKLEEKCKNNDVCEFCKKDQAISFCLAERASFCEECDGMFHANEFTQRHSRYYFNQVGKKRFLHCKTHASVVVDFFCDECKEPVCTQCRIFGTHSELPASKHTLSTYIDACDHLTSLVQQPNEYAENALRKAQASIAGIENEICEFEKNIQIIRERLEYEYKFAINTLNDLIKRRYQKINAGYFEGQYLQKKSQQAIDYPKEVDPSVLVGKWKSIEEVNKSLGETVLPIPEEEPAIVIKGSLTVELDQSQMHKSPQAIGTFVDESLSRHRTEMLLRASQPKAN